jgi:uncharacterized membrane protein YeaQ/YmgE (transglycosylase-associated protein family)
MRVVRWLIALLVLGLVAGFVAGLLRPHRGSIPHPVTS